MKTKKAKKEDKRQSRNFRPAALVTERRTHLKTAKERKKTLKRDGKEKGRK
jgi:hypothetical protein